jgi:hypothetical protein
MAPAPPEKHDHGHKQHGKNGDLIRSHIAGTAMNGITKVMPARLLILFNR